MGLGCHCLSGRKRPKPTIWPTPHHYHTAPVTDYLASDFKTYTFPLKTNRKIPVFLYFSFEFNSLYCGAGALGGIYRPYFCFRDFLLLRGSV